ncbi:hypothetical protein ABZP36_009296 [Zizania latifolia]
MTVAYLKEKTTAPSTSGFASGMRSSAARLLGVGIGSRALNFVGSSGVSRSALGSSRTSGSRSMVNYDGKGTYIISNNADTLFIRDLNSHGKDPVKSIHFSNSDPLCHAFDSEAKDGHDLIVGLLSGDGLLSVFRLGMLYRYLMLSFFISLYCSRCTGVAWIPGNEGYFVVSNADGNLYVYDKSKEGNTDWTFPTVKDQSEVMISHAKSNKVSAVAFDSYWSPPNCDETGENTIYRFGSVGQDAQLLLWDLAMDELTVQLGHPSSCSPTFSSGSPTDCDIACPSTGVLHPSPRMQEVQKLSPLMAQRVDEEPLSALEFTSESILTVCHEGRITLWLRPVDSESNQHPDSSELIVGTAISNEKTISPSNGASFFSSSFKQPSSVLFA